MSNINKKDEKKGKISKNEAIEMLKKEIEEDKIKLYKKIGALEILEQIN